MECLLPAARRMLASVLRDEHLPTRAQLDTESAMLEQEEQLRIQMGGGDPTDGTGQNYCDANGNYNVHGIIQWVRRRRPWFRVYPSMRKPAACWEPLPFVIRHLATPVPVGHYVAQVERSPGVYEEVDSLGPKSKPITKEYLDHATGRKWRLYRMRLDAINTEGEDAIRSMVNDLMNSRIPIANPISAEQVTSKPIADLRTWARNVLMPWYNGRAPDVVKVPMSGDKGEQDARDRRFDAFEATILAEIALAAGTAAYTALNAALSARFKPEVRVQVRGDPRSLPPELSAAAVGAAPPALNAAPAPPAAAAGAVATALNAAPAPPLAAADAAAAALNAAPAPPLAAADAAAAALNAAPAPPLAAADAAAAALNAAPAPPAAATGAAGAESVGEEAEAAAAEAANAAAQGAAQPPPQ
eukprot:gene4545-23331_t